MKIIFERNTLLEILREMRAFIETVDGAAVTAEPAEEPVGEVAAKPAPKPAKPKKAPVEVPDTKSGTNGAQTEIEAPQPAAPDPHAVIAMMKRKEDTIEIIKSVSILPGGNKLIHKLLADFGKGAKSFREIEPSEFGPIADEVDAGSFAIITATLRQGGTVQ